MRYFFSDFLVRRLSAHGASFAFARGTNKAGLWVWHFFVFIINVHFVSDHHFLMGQFEALRPALGVRKHPQS
jgi:hypothetical protein